MNHSRNTETSWKFFRCIKVHTQGHTIKYKASIFTDVTNSMVLLLYVILVLITIACTHPKFYHLNKCTGRATISSFNFKRSRSAAHRQNFGRTALKNVSKNSKMTFLPCLNFKF